MPDNITLPGTGKDIRTTEDSNQKHLQHFILGRSDAPDTPQLSDANGVKVQIGALPAGAAAIGSVGVTSVPADPFGANADAASATGSISAKLRAIAATGVPVTSVVPGTGTTSLGKAVDSAVGATDTGVAALFQRRDTLAAITPVVGDYSRGFVDSVGRLLAAVYLKDSAGNDASFAAPAVVSVDVTTTAVTYGAGKVIGGVLSFTSAAISGIGTGHSLAVRFFDYDDLNHDGTNGAYRLDLYSATPTGGGVANNAAYAVASDAEAGTYICSVFSTDGVWVDVGPAKVCAVAAPGPWAYLCAATTLFGVLVAVTADSGASGAGTGRKVAMHILKD